MGVGGELPYFLAESRLDTTAPTDKLTCLCQPNGRLSAALSLKERRSDRAEARRGVLPAGRGIAVRGPAERVRRRWLRRVDAVYWEQGVSGSGPVAGRLQRCF